MKPKTMILMVVAIGCGLAASYMTSKLLADRSAAPAENKVTVLVAIKKVPAFEPIKNPEKYFVEKEVPEGTYPTKCLKSFEDIRGQRLCKAKGEEETVFKEDLLTKDQQGIIANLPDGQRAMAIRVNPEALAGGFVLPGSRVDLIGTLSSGTGELSAETIMQNMLVLAVDMIFNRDDKTTMLGSTVTFSVTPQEANRLAVATKATDIRLVLRPPTDHEKVTLPPSKSLDWRKPEWDASKPLEGSGDTTDGGPALTSLPKVKKPEEQKVEPVVAAPETTPLVTHKMMIVSGQYEQTAVFVQNDKGEWTRGSARQIDEATPAQVKPAQPVQPAVPAASPADSDKTK